jgi:MoaA/NifB/PqqE/SkfB family radical SAM enzyme
MARCHSTPWQPVLGFYTIALCGTDGLRAPKRVRSAACCQRASMAWWPDRSGEAGWFDDDKRWWRVAAPCTQSEVSAWPRPVVVVLAVNRRCNSRCSYCSVWTDEKPDRPLSDVLAVLDQFASIGAALVALTGGEPLLRTDLETIVDHAKGLGLRVTVTTNGILATAERVLSLEEAGLDALTFSLDTLDRKTYQRLRGVPIDGVLAGIDAARAAASRLVLGVTAVVSAPAIGHTSTLAEYCLDCDLLLGLTPMHTDEGVGTEVSDSDESRAKLAEAISRVRELIAQGLRFPNSLDYLDGLEAALLARSLPSGSGCRSAERTLSVAADGDVHVCPYMPPVGQADDGGIVAFWGSNEHRRVHERMQSGECPGCWHSYRADDYDAEWLEAWFDRS